MCNDSFLTYNLPTRRLTITPYEIPLDTFDTRRMQGFDSANNLLSRQKEHLLATV